MHNSSVDNANKGWDTFFYSVAIGVLGVTVIACGPAVLSSCDRKIRQVFSRASAFFSESARTRVPEPLDSAGVRLLVGPKNLGKLPDGREMVIRPTFPDGNCFFTCAAVGLLEYLQENKEHLEFIVDVIQKDFCLSEDGKQSVIGTLTQLTYLENPEDLEAYFKNNSLMYEMVVLLRHLMGSALEEEPTFETPEDTPKILSKHDFYAEILGAVAHVPEVRKLYPIEPEYTPEAFEKVVALIRQPYIWPSAACIRALCLKLGIDFNILKEIGGGRIHYDPKAKNLPRAGNLLLQGNHYSKVYPLPAFKIVQGTLTTGDSRKVEIQTKQDKPLFLGVAVSLLESLYKKKIFLEELNITS